MRLAFVVVSISFLCFGNIVITNWISAIRQILVIVAIELRDVEDLLIVTYFKAIERSSCDAVFTFDIFQFRAKLFEY